MSSETLSRSPAADNFDDTDMSDDDTDECSEEDSFTRRFAFHGKHPNTEIKEQMYQDKLADLKSQLSQLSEGTHPEWIKKLRRLENSYRERVRINTIIKDLEIEMVEEDFINEKKSAVREFEDQKIYLRDQLIAELEEKQKMIENERNQMELTGDSLDVKPITTRKLRRRANEPTGTPSYGTSEKRRKPVQLATMTYLLDDNEIIEDLKIINKNKAFSMQKSTSGSSSNLHSGVISSPSLPAYPREIKITDGKLFYERRWFRRGQAIELETKSGEKIAAMISAIGSEALWIRKLSDNSKIRIFPNQLSKGKYLLKRRAV